MWKGARNGKKPSDRTEHGSGALFAANGAHLTERGAIFKI